MKKIVIDAALLISLLCCVLHSAVADEGDYQLGRGLKLGDSLTVGGYFSTELVDGDREHAFTVDDVAVLFYGTVAEDLSYFVELESVNFFSKDFQTGSSESNLPPAVERLYLDYKFSDSLAVRAGKQITPIGYWNLQPINVLRETTSNPVYSRVTFPKFLTGLDFYGYTPFDENLTYHVYLQVTEDLDDQYININIERHYGASLEKQVGDTFQFGGSLGKYRDINQTTTRYYQANAKWSAWPVTVQAEGIVNDRDLPFAPEESARAAYVQGEYAFNVRHAIIARAEYVDDDAAAVSRIGVLGYSYRPLFPVSLKVEYQWHADSRDNKVLASFSVLF